MYVPNHQIKKNLAKVSCYMVYMYMYPYLSPPIEKSSKPAHPLSLKKEGCGLQDVHVGARHPLACGRPHLLHPQANIVSLASSS